MKERPIMFSGPMVRAILEGRKTQTRRVCKAMPCTNFPACGSYHQCIGACPYGDPGDRLWVREGFRLHRDWDKHSPGQVFANPAPMVWYEADGEAPAWCGRRRPSVHMPRSLARLELVVTDVRVQQLQAISDQDCEAEGCVQDDAAPHRWLIGGCARASRRLAFSCLWDSINGATRPWASNPWVWVVGFSRVAEEG